VPIGDTVALTASGKVVTFGRAPSATLTSSLTIKGLASGETLLGIDVRPTNSKIYGLSDQGKLYTLDASTGMVTLIGALKASASTPTNSGCPAGTEPMAFSALSGTEFGVDVNPVVDRLRIVSNSGQNLRMNMDTLEVTADCNISASSGSAPKPSAVAYTNGVVGQTAAAASTALFYVDAATDTLNTVDPGTATPPNNANTGVVKVVGALGVDVTGINGFDVLATSSNGTITNTAYAVFTVGSTTGFYRVDLSTGAATALATFGSTGALSGLTVLQ
jgi:hypothetical protein